MPIDDLPEPVPGAVLKSMRERVGVLQKDLAAELGITRGHLYRWEHEPQVDAIRSIRYQQALRRLVEKVAAA